MIARGTGLNPLPPADAELAALVRKKCIKTWSSAPDAHAHGSFDEVVALYLALLHWRADVATVDGIEATGLYLLPRCLRFEGDDGQRAALTEKLATWMEGFLRKVLLLADPERYQLIETRQGAPAGLAAVLGAVGLRRGNLEADPSSLHGQPGFAEHVARAWRARNENHRGREWTDDELVLTNRSVVVACLAAVSLHRKALDLALRTGGREHLLAGVSALQLMCGRAIREAVELDADEEMTDEILGLLDGMAAEEGTADSDLDAYGGWDLEGESVNLDGGGEGEPTYPHSVDGADEEDLPHIGQASEAVTGEDRRPAAIERSWGSAPGTRVRIADLVGEVAHLVLVGPPGAGKTTTLRLLAGRLAQRWLAGDSPASLPVFIELKEIFGGRRLRAALASRLSCTPAVLDDALAADSYTLFLDGFNEVSEDEQDNAIREIASLMEAHPSTSFVLTSRDLPALRKLRAPVWRVDPLTDAQVDAVLLRVLGSAAAAAEAARIIGSDERLSTWGRNPMMLRMLASIVRKRGGDLPRNRAHLFWRCVDWILDREERKPGRHTDRALKVRVLSHLAWATRAVGLRAFSFDRYRESVSQSADDLGTTIDAWAFLREACDNRLLSQSGEDYSFSHELYQEYFAAVELKRRYTNDRGVARSLIGRPEWREPIALMHGLLRDPAELFDALTDLDVTTAASCLAGATDIEESQRRRLVFRCLALLAERPNSRGAECLAALIQIGVWSAVCAALHALLALSSGPPTGGSAPQVYARLMAASPRWSELAVGVLSNLDLTLDSPDREIVSLILQSASIAGPLHAWGRSEVRRIIYAALRPETDPLMARVIVTLGTAREDGLPIRAAASRLIRETIGGKWRERYVLCERLEIQAEEEAREGVQALLRAGSLPAALELGTRWGLLQEIHPDSTHLGLHMLAKRGLPEVAEELAGRFGLAAAFPPQSLLDIGWNHNRPRIAKHPERIASLLAYAAKRNLAPPSVEAGGPSDEQSSTRSDRAWERAALAVDALARGRVPEAIQLLPEERIRGKCRVLPGRPFGYLRLGINFGFHFHPSDCCVPVHELDGSFASAKLTVTKRRRDGAWVIDAIDVTPEPEAP